MASKDFDKFVKFATENVLKNWGKLVGENIRNNLEDKELPKEISMIDALENIGIELTADEKECFKDRVLTFVDTPEGYPTWVVGNKKIYSVNYVDYNPEEK